MTGFFAGLSAVLLLFLICCYSDRRSEKATYQWNLKKAKEKYDQLYTEFRDYRNNAEARLDNLAEQSDIEYISLLLNCSEEEAKDTIMLLKSQEFCESISFYHEYKFATKAFMREYLIKLAKEEVKKKNRKN